MSLESSVPILTFLVSVGVSVLLAGIPWAYGIHGRLTMIETTLKEHLRNADRVDAHELRIARLEIQGEQKHASAH